MPLTPVSSSNAVLGREVGDPAERDCVEQVAVEVVRADVAARGLAEPALRLVVEVVQPDVDGDQDAAVGGVIDRGEVHGLGVNLDGVALLGHRQVAGELVEPELDGPQQRAAGVEAIDATARRVLVPRSIVDGGADHKRVVRAEVELTDVEVGRLAEVGEGPLQGQERALLGRYHGPGLVGGRRRVGLRRGGRCWPGRLEVVLGAARSDQEQERDRGSLHARESSAPRDIVTRFARIPPFLLGLSLPSLPTRAP